MGGMVGGKVRCNGRKGEGEVRWEGGNSAMEQHSSLNIHS